MLNLFKSLNMRGEVDMLTGGEPMTKFNLCFRTLHQIKMLLVNLRPTIREVVVHKVLRLLV